MEAPDDIQASDGTAPGRNIKTCTRRWLEDLGLHHTRFWGELAFVLANYYAHCIEHKSCGFAQMEVCRIFER